MLTPISYNLSCMLFISLLLLTKFLPSKGTRVFKQNGRHTKISDISDSKGSSKHYAPVSKFTELSREKFAHVYFHACFRTSVSVAWCPEIVAACPLALCYGDPI